MVLNKFEQLIDRRHNHDLSTHEIEVMNGYIKAFGNEGPSFDDFENIYPPEELARDQQEIERLKKLFNQENKDQHFYARALEIILMEFSNSWIPGYLSKVSEYDDIKRKTDLILEAETEESVVVRIGLDVTSSETAAAEKINGLKDGIEHGTIGQPLKYFASEINDTKGPINVPRLVIGATREEIVELSRSYIHYKNSRPEDRPAIRQRIENHPMGQQLLD